MKFEDPLEEVLIDNLRGTKRIKIVISSDGKKRKLYKVSDLTINERLLSFEVEESNLPRYTLTLDLDRYTISPTINGILKLVSIDDIVNVVF